jgi:hypothetical protein
MKKNNDEITIFLTSAENIKIRKALYLINIFENFYIKLKEMKSPENDLSKVENEVFMIFNSLYLPSLKTIFRTLTSYLNNLTDDEKNNLDNQNIEVQFLIKFQDLYKNTTNMPKDKLFEGNFKIANELIQK